MHLAKIEILNLWGEDNITLNFENPVTFLTGCNGSGKSTLLNVIYDTVNLNDKNKQPSTSKNRFWSAEAEFLEGLLINTALLPESEGKSSTIEKIDEITNISTSFALHNLKALKEVEQTYRDETNNNAINHVSYTNQIKSELKVSKVCTSNHFSAEEAENLVERISNKSLSFLFQEDRNTLHNMEKSNIDFSMNYWGYYKNSIDERFTYLRDTIQIHESHINKNIIDLMRAESDLTRLQNSADYQNQLNKTNEFNNVITLLDGYFVSSNKQMTRDEDNKLTLRHIGSDEIIPWHLLSRGEKTLIYLFFVVFLYQNKVEVFLFDEPEISLHVKWQDHLIKDLSDLAPDSQFIIATHSPSLIQNGWLGNCLEISPV
ncbi:MAG: putative ATPase [Phenylobacterium sp.]|jgi:predicted ATPase